MAIFFRCICGQDLRANEEQAGDRLECPACCRLVPVPSLALDNQRLGIASVPMLEIPTQLLPPAPLPLSQTPALPLPVPSPKGAAPPGLNLAEDPVYRLARDVDIRTEDARRAEELGQARWLFAQAREELNGRRRRGGRWQTETQWFHCLLYPLRAWPILLSLAFAWATLVAIALGFLPDEWDWTVLAPRLPLLLLPFLLLCYTCGFYWCTFTSATGGEAGVIRWPGGDLLQALWCGTACLVCFLAGPIVLCVVAFLFWVHSGDLALIDWLILGELGLVAVGYWALALLAVDENGRLRDANPVAVARLARRLEWRGWVTVMLLGIGVLVTFHFGLIALEALHLSPAGWMALGWLGFWGPAWVVFLLRWFGLSRFHAQERRKRERDYALPDGQRRPAVRAQGQRSGPAALGVPPEKVEILPNFR